MTHARLQSLEDGVLRAFSAYFGGTPELLTQAPGRVNLIGEHTDYNDGFVLPCGIPRFTLIAARRRPDSWVHAVAADYADARTAFDLQAPILPDPTQPWSNYLRGMAALMPAEGLRVAGADLVIAGNLPRGAGLSSSASLEVAAGMALSCLAGETAPDLTQLARIAQRAEQEFAGCPCGIMDQLAVCRSVAGHALLLDCRSLQIEQVRMPENAAVMIVHSGVTRELVTGAYAERRAQCTSAAQALQVPALRDATLGDLQRARSRMDPLTWRRAHHVISENARTLSAAQYLKDGDLTSLGRVMAESHASMRDDFAITVPAMDRLVDVLQATIGERGGARMTGGGFGGAAVAILEASHADRVMAQVRKAYRTPQDLPPDIYLETAADGVRSFPWPRS